MPIASSNNTDAITDNWPFDYITPTHIPDAEWGEGVWGTGEWGTETAFTTESNPDTSEALYDLLVACATELDGVDAELDVLYDQRFLQTATDEELEKLAAEVTTQRETGELDDRLRFRALISKAVTRSDGTLDDIGAVLYVLFGERTKNITVSAAPDKPILRLTLPTELINDIPLSASELESELRNIIAVSDSLEIFTDETFVLGESGSQGIGEGKLV